VDDGIVPGERAGLARMRFGRLILRHRKPGQHGPAFVNSTIVVVVDVPAEPEIVT
jgi:hypothetical protein